VITCAEAVRQLWDYLDGVVAETDRAAIEEHLSFCRRCCGEVEFAEELRSFLAAHRDEQLPPDVRARLVQTLDQLGSP
jgi:anti-sigma factor (TIGR02949 family)